MYIFRNEDGFVSIEDEKLQISSYCRFVSFTTDNFTLIATTVAIVFVTWILNFLYSRYQKRREEFKELTNRMAKETIDVLQSHAARWNDLSEISLDNIFLEADMLV